MAEKNIFITGATGFIGKEILKGLNEKSKNIYLLIRPSKTQSAKQRFQKLLSELPETVKLKCHLVEGDITLQNLGLLEKEFQKLAEQVNVIYHIAAGIELTAPLYENRRSNVFGTKTILQLAYLSNKSGFKQLHYISTAYVAGKRKGIIYENELNFNQSFNNPYEQAKFEAEMAVEQAKQDLPICIYRPSMVMGHSITGWTSAFNVLYGPIKMGYFGNLPIAPGCNNSKIDAVPIDYVVDAILYLSQYEMLPLGTTFHISVGLNNSISAVELREYAFNELKKLIEQYGLDNPMQEPLMINPLLFKTFSQFLYRTASGKRKAKLKKLLTYVNYTLFNKEFCNSEANKYLIPAGIIAPRLQDYMDVVCKYAVENHFGKANGPQSVYKRSWLNKFRHKNQPAAIPQYT